MADTSGQVEIRGIKIQPLALEYLDQALIFKKYCQQISTDARLVRYWTKTSGFISPTSPESIVAAENTKPFELQQSWTRSEVYVKTYMLDSPMISEQDIKDSPIGVLTSNVQDLSQAVAYKIDTDIYNVMTENQSASLINSNATAAAWNAASYTGVNIVEDLMEAKQNIYVNSGFSPEGAVLLLSPLDHRSMINWLIDAKGANIPTFASQRIQDGVVMEICGLKVVVSTNVVADSACVVLDQKAVQWFTFTDMQTFIIDEQGIGKKIRIKAEGIAVLARPKCVNLITNTQA